MLNRIVADRVELQKKGGSLPVFKGNPDYWQVLDHSFDLENRRKIEASISNKNVVSDKVPALADLKKVRAPDMYHKKGLLK